MTVIAVTREIGSIGTEVAAGIAEKLGLENVCSEIVADKVARRLGVTEELVRRQVDGSASLLDRWQVNRRRLSRYTKAWSEVADGKITLAGTSTSGCLRAEAERIAYAVAGRANIENRIISVPSRGRAH
jgi:osmotically-inducible protein OsmY